MKLNKALKIIIACGGFLFVCIFISINAHAETVYNNTLPFYFDSVDDFNSWINQSILNSIDNYGLPVYDDDYVLICTDYQAYGIEGSYNIYRGWFYLSPLESFSDTTNFDDWYTHSLNYTLISSKPSYFFGVHYDIFGGFTPIVFNVSEASSPRGALFGYSPTTVTRFDNSQVTFTPYVPVYFNKDFKDNYDNVVLYFDGSSGTTITGSAVAPNFGAGAGNGSDFLGANADFGASVSQATKPTAPTITNYTWNTYNAPTVDTSTLETLIQSLIDIVKYNTTYIVGGITGLIENLLTNIQNMFAYIGALIEYSLRVLVTNIQNAIQNLYENFKSLVEPIFQLLDIVKEKVEYITEPFDKEEFFHQVDGNHLITACIHIEDYGEQMKSILTNAQERNTFHLNISYPKPDGTSFNTMISFDWLYPLRHLYMPYLWVFTILYLFFSACRLLGNVIGGKS